MVEKEKMSIMRVIYDRTRSKMLVVSMRVIYTRQNLAKERRKERMGEKS